ncbi:MAG: hypothetical protein ACLTJ8_04005 [Veillonella atypica]
MKLILMPSSVDFWPHQRPNPSRKREAQLIASGKDVKMVIVDLPWPMMDFLSLWQRINDMVKAMR